MGDEDYRMELIDTNISVLVKSTVIGPELVIELFAKGLIDHEEKDILLNSGAPNYSRAALLYTTLANKWNRCQFEDFKKALRSSGNSHALQVLTKDSPEIFLSNEQVHLLRVQRHKSGDGCYEGLSLEDEVNANNVVRLAREGGMFREDGKLVLSGGLERKQAIYMVKRFVGTLKNDVIWWNPKKPPLPLNYIARRVARTDALGPDGKLPWHVGSQTLIELTENQLVLLVDAPGMGKSSEITQLEQKLRTKINSNRIIVRVNLNEVERRLSTLSPSESASNVLLKIAPFLPMTSLTIPEVSVFVLLDGLDEVCPKHQMTMINILRILISGEQSMNDINFRVFVTTRPHLKRSLEDEFQLASWSLLPLTEEEQDEYMKSVMGVSREQLSAIRGSLTHSLAELLSNPLMLFLLVEVGMSSATFSEGEENLNIFDVYTKFVDSKHMLHLVQKEGMMAESNFTEMRLEGMLQRNLPHYYRLALTVLIDFDIGDKDSAAGRIIRECGGGVVALNEPSGVTRTELLSIGLLTEDPHSQLVFNHRSFGEFFYARLLFESSIPQIVRDMLFCSIYRNNGGVGVGLENVETFVLTAASVLTRQMELFPLTPKWLLMEDDFSKRCQVLNNFVTVGKLFPLFAREILMSFVKGQPHNLWEVLQVLLHEESSVSFTKLCNWMSENREWTRMNLLQFNEQNHLGGGNDLSQPIASLMIAIALKFEGQEEKLFTQEEVGAAVMSCDHRLINIVAQINTEVGRKSGSKWDFIERNFSGGRSQLRELFRRMDDEDFSLIVKDKETAWRLINILSQEEIFSLVADEETRASDIVGRSPRDVVVAFGQKILPPLNQLAKFRGKFGSAKGKTLFEISDGGCDFGVKCLWGDLLLLVLMEGQIGTEADFVSSSNSKLSIEAVGMAVNESLRGMMGESGSWSLIEALEREVRRRRPCPNQLHRLIRPEDDYALEKKNKNFVMETIGEYHTRDHHQVGITMMDWVTKEFQWNSTTTPASNSMDTLPFLLRYSPISNHTKINDLLLHHKKSQLQSDFHVMALLRSVVISSLRSDDFCFSLLVAFLHENLSEFQESLRPAANVFLEVKKEEVKMKSMNLDRLPLSSLPLVCDVSVGGVLLRILPAIQKQAKYLGKETWILVVRDLIQFTPCCDLPFDLNQLQIAISPQLLSEENLLKEVLTSAGVFTEWQERFWCIYRREGEEFDLCSLTHLLSFYFSVFGLNLNWMKVQDGETVGRADKWNLVKRLPVEIAVALGVNKNWTHLLPHFQVMLNDFLREKSISSVGEIARWFPYEKQGEWVTLLNLINGEKLLVQPPRLSDACDSEDIPSASVAAPLICTLINLYGIEWTKSRFTPELWNKIPFNLKYVGDSVEALGSLLQSAIGLGELEQVERRAWPGVFAWRNSQGKDALDVALEKLDENDPIRVYLDTLTFRSQQ